MASNTNNKRQLKNAINTASSEMFSSQQSGALKKSVDSSLTNASSLSSQRSSVTSSRDSNNTLTASENENSMSVTSSFSPTKILAERGLIETPSNKGYDLREHLQQLMKLSDSEYSSDDYSVESYESESDDREEELKQLVSKDDQPSTPKPTDQKKISNALVPIEEDDIDSEEENEIMKEIKEEIKNKVREEMKSELDLYRAKKETLEGGGPQTSSSKPGVADDLENLEPKLREAFIKMRKLDKILAKRVRREKDVKRDRILLERRIRSEIEDLKNEGGGKYKEVTTNTQKFLALELPPSHNEGVELPEEGPETPVFRTQLNENEYPEFNSRAGKRAGGGSHSSRAGSEDQDGQSEGGDTGSSMSGTKERKHRRKHKKNFIKRNKELAADADNAIAMTEEEKKRLEDLLTDVDTIPEIIADNFNEDGDDNPFQITVHPGEGYLPDMDESRSLTSIDSRLREILPPEEFDMVSSRSALSHAPQHKLFTRTTVKSAMEYDKLGEKALIQNKEERDIGERLKAIEDELAKLHNPDEIEIVTPHLEEDQLKDLIDQCVTSLSHVSMSRTSLSHVSMSRTSMLTDDHASFDDVESRAETVDSTPRSPRSARQEVLDNPPKLDPEVLQKLLSEAYYPMSSHLSTLQEEEDEEDASTPIPAEVWKLISMETGEKGENTPNKMEDSKSGNGDSSKPRMGSRQSSQEIMEKRSRKNNHRNSSRISTQSSLNNGANSDNGLDSELSGWESQQSGRDSDLSGRDSKTPFLPPIDPAGTLVTQGLNNQVNQRTNSSSSVRTPVSMVRNSLTDSKTDNCDSDRMEIISLDGDFSTPRPPTSEKQRHSSNKFRTVTPVNK